MPKKIVFFSLKYGLIHSVIKPLMPYLTANGYEVICVHANSLSSRLPVVDVAGLTQIDVGERSFRQLYKYLKDAKVDIFISLGYKSLFDILFRQVTESLGGKSLYMEHGLFIVGLCDSYNFVLSDSLPRYLKLFSLYLTFMSLNVTRSISYLASGIRAMAFGNYNDLKHDKALFYTPKGSDLVSHFKFDKDELHFAGYPLVSDAATIDKLQGSRKLSDYVVFLHQPVIRDNLVSISYENERDFLVKISDTYAKLGLRFIFKIHPRESFEHYVELFKGTNVQVSNDDLFTVVKDARYILSQFSTALFFGILFNIPIIINKYPTLQDVYLDIFRDLALVDPSEDEILKIDANYDGYLTKIKGTYDMFAQDYIGYHNNYEYQAKTICDIIEA